MQTRYIFACLFLLAHNANGATEQKQTPSLPKDCSILTDEKNVYVKP